MPLNIFDSIINKQPNMITPRITHILSYDLKNATPKTYTDLSNNLRKNFSGTQTHLQSQTVWELCTIESCDAIIRTVISIAGVNNCQVNVYQVGVIEKKTHSSVLPKKLLQK